MLSSLFGDCDVHLCFEINSVKVASVYFSIFSIVRMLFAVYNFIQFRNFGSLLDLLSRITFGPQSKYRKILPAAVANQIAEIGSIPTTHERKQNKWLHESLSDLLEIFYDKKEERFSGELCK